MVESRLLFLSWAKVLNEELKTGRFVKKIGLHPEEREYFDIELENTAICLVQDGILMMSSIFVHEANALKVEVLEDFDAPALPAGMVPMGPLLSLWPEHVTFLEEVHVVLPVCSGAKNAWCTTDGGWKQVPVQIRQNIMIASLPHFCKMLPAGEPIDIKALGYIKNPDAKVVLAHVECHECMKKLKGREKDPHILEDFILCKDPALLDEHQDGDEVVLSQPAKSFHQKIQLKFQRFPFVSPSLSAQSGSSFKAQIDDETIEFQVDGCRAEVYRPQCEPLSSTMEELPKQTPTVPAKQGFEVRLKWQEPIVIEVDLSELSKNMSPDFHKVLAQERGNWHKMSEDLYFKIWTDANVARAHVAQRSLCLEHVEQVTFALVRKICMASGLIFAADKIKRLTKIVRCRKAGRKQVKVRFARCPLLSDLKNQAS